MLVVDDRYISYVTSGTPDFYQAAERDLAEDRLLLINHQWLNELAYRSMQLKIVSSLL